MKKVLLILISICVVFVITYQVFIAQTKSTNTSQVYISNNLGTEYLETSYEEYLNLSGYNGTMSNDKIDVDISSFETSEEAVASYQDQNIVTNDMGLVTWDFNVKKAGFYNLKVTYSPYEGTNSNIERKILIDGEMPYKGLDQIVFNQKFDNTGGEAITIKNNNEIRPISTKVDFTESTYVTDSLKRNLSPYVFYLEPGKHTLTFEAIREPIEIKEIVFETAPATELYADKIETLKSEYPVYEGEVLTYQAERIEGGTTAVYKSTQGIGNTTDYANPVTEPFHPYYIKLNTIGGKTWRQPGEYIEWEIDVPEKGLYNISFRAKQNINRGVSSFRALYVNGEIPYQEAEKIGFTFNGDFQNYVLESNGETMLVPLEAGKNTIRLESNIGDFAESLGTIENSLTVLNDLYRQTIQITGLSPDKFIDYEIDKKVPTFAPTLAEQSEILFGVVDDLVEITGEKGEKTVLIETMAFQAQRLSENPEDVILEISTFKNNISSLGNWVISISEMPLEVDSIMLYSNKEDIPEPTANFFVDMYYSTVRFLATFFVDETKLSDAETEKEAITVWVPTGRDQAQIIKNLIDESFTPNSDIPVNLQLIPMDVVLPATLAGTGPDIVLDVPQSTVMNFAVRNALVDLSEFEGFDEISDRFYQSGIDTATFNEGVYGLPERQWFPMMYVRNDILDKVGIEAPETMDELEKAIMELQIQNYDVYIPGVSYYSTLVYQYGGELYLGEGADYGIESGLGSDEAMYAFQKLTEFFTSYKLPVVSDFSNRFRTGEMPIGIADYTFFNTLELFAPEIRGLWSFYPVPGVEDENGNINNSVVTTANHSIMLDSTEDKESAWEFMQWWLSTETQTAYALSLESIMGTAGRYATGMPEVLTQLPWSRDAQAQLLTQFDKTIGIPEVPGGYMTSRMVDYAYRSVVTNSNAMSPREALYLNYLEINEELTKKREEFHLSTKEKE